MKMHLGQLLNESHRRGKREPSKAGLPAWIPPAHIIPLIDRMEREKSRRKRPPAEQPRVEIDMDDPAEQNPNQKKDDDEDRGVAIIEL